MANYGSFSIFFDDKADVLPQSFFPYVLVVV